MSEMPPSPDPPTPVSVTDPKVYVGRPELSIVLPVFNEEPVIDELHRRLGEFLAAVGTTWEVIFVDDGSSDQSFAKLRALAAAEQRYRVISFARNFGHQFAITAGIDYARGRRWWSWTLICETARGRQRNAGAFSRGHDIVHGVRRKREKKSRSSNASAFLFYRVLRSLVGITVPVDASVFDS
jgi:dolichol-phosphate mannosyltransferase